MRRASCFLPLVAGLLCCVRVANAQTVYNVGTAGDLAAAMDSLGNGDTINFTGDITLTSSLSVLQATGVTINGNGHTLDGAGAYNGFFVYAGSSAINNLTIAHTTATGGSASGGAGLGAGGAIFVNSGAAVVLTNMTFTNNQAVGGTSVGSGTGGGGGILSFPAGAAGTDDPGSAATAGTGGSGGFGGGGGAGGYASGGYGGTGGAGGFGGGGGIGGNGIAGGRGGIGGYGGGGGGGGQGTTSTYGAGAAGFGGGIGGGASGGFYTNAFGGGGGAGLGGAIFVMEGASITFSGNIVETGGSVAGGAGIFGGGNGQGAGTAIFLQGSGTLAFAPAAGFTQTIGDVISDEVGSGLSGNGGTNGQWGLSKSGAGTLVLNSANQFTGSTTVTGGSLVLGNAAALQHSTLNSATGLGFGSLTSATLGGLAGSGNLALTNASAASVALTVGQNNADTTYAGALSGSGSLVKTGGGTLTLTGLNAQTGGVTLNSGTLTVANGATLGGATGALVVNAGTLNLNAAQTVSSLSGAGGTINFTAPLTVNNTGADNFAGTITGANLTKTGSGSLTLPGFSSLSGTIAVQNGVLALASTPGAGVTTVTLGNGTTGGDLRFSDVQAGTFSPGQILVAGTGINRLAMGGALTVTSPISAATAGATLTIDRVGPNNNAAIYFNGNITDGAGTLGLVVASGQAVLNGSANSFSGGLTVNGGSIATTSNLTVSSLNGTGGSVGVVAGKVFTVNNTGSDTFAGGIFDGYDGSNPADRGFFAKSGSGTLTLTGGGGSYYSGGTTISGGTLLANNTSGSALGFGPVLVQSGATLGGTGFIGGVDPFDGQMTRGVTTIATGAHLSPGAAAPGTLTFASGLTLNDGAMLNFRLGTAGDEVLVTGGTLTGPASAAGATFYFSAASGFAAGTYDLIDGSSAGVTLAGFDATKFALGTGIGGYSFAFVMNGNVLQVTATAIPEPAIAAPLLGVLALGLAAVRRRRA